MPAFPTLSRALSRSTLIALLLAGCGGGGGSTERSADTLLDNQALYDTPGTDLIEMYVTIWPEDNPESEEDVDCPFVNTTDGIGTTLDDVNQDVINGDDCKPELNVHLQVAGIPDAGGVANAAMRLRGHSTRFADQKSYRIKLKSKAAGDQWRGQRVFNLNKHPYDLTRLRNKLCFDLFSQIPHMTSLRTQFVRLYVDQRDGNGFVDYGLFTHVEKVDDTFLAAHGLDPAGSLYKAEFFEFERYEDSLKLESDPTFNKDAFERILEIEEGSDHAPLLAMLDAVNDEDTDFDEMLSTYFNRDNYLTWLACNILFNNLDTNSQNFFLYRRSDATIFYFLGWDYDGAFDFYGQPDQVLQESLGRWQRSIANWWGVTLHRRFLKQPGSIAALSARMREIRDSHASESRIRALIDSYGPTVQPCVAQSPDLDFLPVFDDASVATMLAEYDAEAARLPGLVAANYQKFLDTLERPMPVYMSDTVDGADIEFRWDASFDLQSDGLTYDFELSTSPTFEPGDRVTQGLGLTNTTTYRYPLASLPAGTYYYRVIIRDTKNPSENWQIAFDEYWDEYGDKSYFGVRKMVIE